LPDHAEGKKTELQTGERPRGLCYKTFIQTAKPKKVLYGEGGIPKLLKKGGQKAGHAPSHGKKEEDREMC